LLLYIEAFKKQNLFVFDSTWTDLVRYGSSVHIKTALTGGLINHGYPDDTYDERYQGELFKLGITKESLGYNGNKGVMSINDPYPQGNTIFTSMGDTTRYGWM